MTPGRRRGAGEGSGPRRKPTCWRCRIRTGSTTTCGSPATPAEVAAFRAAAAGAGVIPWAARPRPGGGGLVPPAGGAAGAAAAQPQPGGLPHPRRPAARCRRGAAAAGRRAGRGQPGLPARPAPAAAGPRRLLRLGPEQPETLAWLWAHWGTTAGAARRGGAAGARAGPAAPAGPRPAGGWASGRPTGRPGAAILAAARPLAWRCGSRSGRSTMTPEPDRADAFVAARARRGRQCRRAGAAARRLGGPARPAARAAPGHSGSTWRSSPSPPSPSSSPRRSTPPSRAGRCRCRGWPSGTSWRPG